MDLELRSLESERDHDLQRDKLAIERDKISRDKQERAYFVPSRVCKLVPPFKEQDKKSLRRFLGTIGYYRRFCVNLSSLINPLTNLLGKNVMFIWSKE